MQDCRAALPVVQPCRMQRLAVAGVRLARQLHKPSPVGMNMHVALAGLGLESLETVIAEAPRAKQSDLRLMAEMLKLGLREAMGRDEEQRHSARAWLTNAPGLSAEECCDGLGIEYEAMLAALRRQWTAWDQAKRSRVMQ